MAGADEVPRERGPAQLAAHATMCAWWDPLVAAQLNDPDQDALTYLTPNNVRARMPWPGTWVLAYRASSPPRLGVAFRRRSGAHREAAAGPSGRFAGGATQPARWYGLRGG